MAVCTIGECDCFWDTFSMGGAFWGQSPAEAFKTPQGKNSKKKITFFYSTILTIPKLRLIQCKTNSNKQEALIQITINYQIWQCISHTIWQKQGKVNKRKSRTHSHARIALAISCSRLVCLLTKHCHHDSSSMWPAWKMWPVCYRLNIVTMTVAVLCDLHGKCDRCATD